MPTFQDEVTRQVNEKLQDSHNIKTRMPHFYGVRPRLSPDSKLFEPLPPNANGQQWNSKINAMLEAVKDLYSNSRDDVQVSREVLAFTTDLAEVLSHAYFIQGKVLLKVCERVGIDFDSLLADFAVAKDEAGIAFVTQDTQPQEHVEEKSIYQAATLPF